MGLITGAGFCPLVDGVKKKLAIEEVWDTEHVLGIIKEETKRTLNDWRTYPQIESWIEQTGWIFSYTTLLNVQPLLRVAVFHPSLSKDRHVTYGEGDPAIIFPVELGPETAQVIRDSMLNRIKIPKDSAELQTSIAQNSAAIAELIGALQPHCPSVSRRIQVGIHTGGQTGISNIIDIPRDGTLSLSIKLTRPSREWVYTEWLDFVGLCSY